MPRENAPEVPEPASFSFLFIGLVVVALPAIRRQRRVPHV
jgi:hypothetical protein